MIENGWYKVVLWLRHAPWPAHPHTLCTHIIKIIFWKKKANWCRYSFSFSASWMLWRRLLLWHHGPPYYNVLNPLKPWSKIHLPLNIFRYSNPAVRRSENRGSYCWMGRVSSWIMESSEDGWWWWWYNSVTVLDTTELYTSSGWNIRFVLYALLQE